MNDGDFPRARRLYGRAAEGFLSLWHVLGDPEVKQVPDSTGKDFRRRDRPEF